MALKDLLFIKEDQPKKAVSETKTKFPDALPKSEDMKANLNKFPSCDPYIEDVIEIYDNGFNALNMSGYDFYEFYKAIVASGDTSPIVYKMAFNMGKSMDPSLTKEKLITQSDFYLGEIDKVHN